MCVYISKHKYLFFLFSIVSILTKVKLTSEQIQNFNYSDTYARFKTLKLLKKEGFKFHLKTSCIYSNVIVKSEYI